ncbi:MAG: DUF3450 family protein [Verrucomicrobiota bacterium]
MYSPPSAIAYRGLLLLVFSAHACLSITSMGQEKSVSDRSSLPPEALEEPDVVREALVEWIETKRIISKELSDWEQEKEMLRPLNEVRKRETEELQAFVDAAGERAADLAAKRAALSDEESELKSFRGLVESRIGAMVKRLQPKLTSFPPPLRDQTEEAISSLEGPAEHIPLQNRVRSLLLILQAFNEFQSTISVHGDLLELDGELRQVDVLYLGMSRAFYVDESGKFAGIGLPAEKGWSWKEQNGLSSKIREAISIHSRDAAPAFVNLPLSNGRETK